MVSKRSFFAPISPFLELFPIDNFLFTINSYVAKARSIKNVVVEILAGNKSSVF